METALPVLSPARKPHCRSNDSTYYSHATSNINTLAERRQGLTSEKDSQLGRAKFHPVLYFSSWFTAFRVPVPSPRVPHITPLALKHKRSGLVTAP